MEDEPSSLMREVREKEGEGKSANETALFYGTHVPLSQHHCTSKLIALSTL
jgi:hypothetical protein